jgi:hypothetical protein
MRNIISSIKSIPTLNIKTVNPACKKGFAIKNSLDNKYYYSNGTNWISYNNYSKI